MCHFLTRWRGRGRAAAAGAVQAHFDLPEVLPRDVAWNPWNPWSPWISQLWGDLLQKVDEAAQELLHERRAERAHLDAHLESWRLRLNGGQEVLPVGLLQGGDSLDFKNGPKNGPKMAPKGILKRTDVQGDKSTRGQTLDTGPEWLLHRP